MLKKFLFVLAICPLVTFANQLPDYNAIKTAIEHGNPIGVSFDFKQCTPSMPIKSYYSPNAIMLSKNSLAFSLYHVTVNNPKFLNHAIAVLIAL